MDARLAIHNLHRQGLAAFTAQDPHLRRLARLPLIWASPVLGHLPRDEPGVYVLRGARQVGKTTLAKQWMVHLLEAGVPPRAVRYVSGELVDDHQELLRRIAQLREEVPSSTRTWVVVDDVTSVRQWDQAIRILAEGGWLARTVLLLIGADLRLPEDLRSPRPDRSGRAREDGFHLPSLTWLEAATLDGSLSAAERSALAADGPFDPRSLDEDGWRRCWTSLDAFLTHGGFLTAMNDVAEVGAPRASTLAAFMARIHGDAVRGGRSSAYLREILAAWVERSRQPVTWRAMARDLSIDHPATVAAYLHLLERQDTVYVQRALQEKGLCPAPRKARKLGPTAPFVFHAIRQWLAPADDPFREAIRPLLRDPEGAAALVESVVVAHAGRTWPAYYLRLPQGEIDLAVVDGERSHLLQVRWQARLQPADVKLLARRGTGIVAARTEVAGRFEGLTVLPLPRVLARLAVGCWPTD